jgi:hypothetical protein
MVPLSANAGMAVTFEEEADGGILAPSVSEWRGGLSLLALSAPCTKLEHLCCQQQSYRNTSGGDRTASLVNVRAD